MGGGKRNRKNRRNEERERERAGGIRRERERGKKHIMIDKTQLTNYKGFGSQPPINRERNRE